MAIRPYSSQFRVVGSTAAVDARDNTNTTGTGVPIYWLNGGKVADNYADFYDGSWEQRGESEVAIGNRRYTGINLGYHTGSKDDGTEYFTSGGTSFALGAGTSRTGRLNQATGNPLSAGNQVRRSNNSCASTASPRCSRSRRGRRSPM